MKRVVYKGVIFNILGENRSSMNYTILLVENEAQKKVTNGGGWVATEVSCNDYNFDKKYIGSNVWLAMPEEVEYAKEIIKGVKKKLTI